MFLTLRLGLVVMTCLSIVSSCAFTVRPTCTLFIDPKRGARWKKFGPRTIVIQLGADWFNKAKTGAKSILGLYARVLNLPMTHIAKRRFMVSCAWCVGTCRLLVVSRLLTHVLPLVVTISFLVDCIIFSRCLSFPFPYGLLLLSVFLCFR